MTLPSAGCCRARRVRCVETVRPLAEKSGLRVETTDVLQEGAPVEKAYDLLTKLAGKKGDSVLCAHGDLVPALIEAVARGRHRHRARAVGQGFDLEARVGQRTLHVGAVLASAVRLTSASSTTIVPANMSHSARRWSSSSAATTDIAYHATDACDEEAGCAAAVTEHQQPDETGTRGNGLAHDLAQRHEAEAGQLAVVGSDDSACAGSISPATGRCPSR